MSRITDAIIGKGTAYATKDTPVPDLKYGGMNGHFARIGRVGADGKTYDEWISNQAYVQRNIIPVVIRAPKFFNYMPEPEKWIEAYKALMELHPLTITGLTSGLTVDVDTHAVGGAGEEQEEVTNVKRAKSVVSTTFKEKANKAITKYLDAYIRYGIMDPDTKKPLVADLIDSIDAIGGMYTADFYTGTVLYVEPDVTQKYVVDSWLCTNLFPKSNGERTGKRDIHNAGEAPELTIEWGGITMNNNVVSDLAEKILKDLTVLTTIPDNDMVAPADSISSDVAGSAVGFQE